jgi:predicted HicB family RNase H-like nuclease
MATKKDIFVKNVPQISKGLLYQLAYQSGYSLNEYVKKIIRDHLHQKFPDRPIE